MNLRRILSELHAERNRIDEAMAVLEQMARTQSGKRRGRPQKSTPSVERKGFHLVERTRSKGSSSASHGEITGNTASG